MFITVLVMTKVFRRILSLWWETRSGKFDRGKVDIRSFRLRDCMLLWLNGSLKVAVYRTYLFMMREENDFYIVGKWMGNIWRMKFLQFRVNRLVQKNSENEREAWIFFFFLLIFQETWKLHDFLNVHVWSRF